ncbi:MAG: beta-propeller domain-containing protein [Myxococcales bacterium]|nr:beta-propeller domain-containing protein [Myxococcales bacterium]
MHTRTLFWIVCISLLGTFACGGDSHKGPDNDDNAGIFVSADAFAGQAAGVPAGTGGAGGATATAAPSVAEAGGDGVDNSRAGASVVEGDIYRVLDQGRILNLNSYRGLQVIDIADPSEPSIIGHYAVAGEPEEMYVQGDRALVLLNGYQAYYGSRDDVRAESRSGGLLLSVSLADPAKPVLIDQRLIEGYVRKSRLVQGDNGSSLFVVSSHGVEVQSEQGYLEYREQTVVTSFDVTAGMLDKVTELELEGYVQDIQATSEVLMVAHQQWLRNDDRSLVTLVDISDPAGSMVLGDSVQVAGYIENQFRMDLHEGILRVVSTDWQQSINTVQTFDAADLGALSALDSCAFGAGQDLYATLFVGDKAFFVTYLRQDPFHAFAMGADGSCQERSEYIVSGWNDFFRPVADATRLIGVGIDDADGGRAPAVSLYDITNLDNAEPLLARAAGDTLQWSWSEASWDHRAFSVLENALSVNAADGTEERGLVLLPFQGSEVDAQGHYRGEVSGVHLFTFSDSTVTLRGQMKHDSPVRRSFLAGDDLSANLSESSLALYDHGDPDAPALLGSVELAPNYGRLLRYGDYRARLTRPSYDYYYDPYLEGSQEVPQARLEIIEAAADPNTTNALASFEVDADVQLLKAGDLLLSVSYRMVDTSKEELSYETTVRVFDLSDPKEPAEVGKAVSDSVRPSYFGYDGYFGGFGGGFVGCGMGPLWFGGGQAEGSFVVGDALVFVDAEPQDELLGRERVCNFWPQQDYETSCADPECMEWTESYYEGYRTCRTLEGGPEICEGEYRYCSYSFDGSRDCGEPVDLAELALEESCWDNERYRYWSSYRFTALDLSSPSEPRFGQTQTMDRSEESVRVLPQGDKLYYSFRKPYELEGDERPHVRYFYREVDASDPAALVVGDAVNVPGELIAVDGERLYTRDLRWGQAQADTWLHQLSVGDAGVAIEASLGFEGRNVRSVVSEDGHLLVSHDDVAAGGYYGVGVPIATDAALPGGFGTSGGDVELSRLSIVARDGLEVVSEVDIDRYAELQASHDARALYNVPGGLLMLNIEDASAPYAQAFFTTRGWPEQILFDGDALLVTAGPYGIYRFDTDAFNLLPVE